MLKSGCISLNISMKKYKNMFIGRYKQPDIVEDCKVFLEKIEKLKPYIIEFNKNSIIKSKFYLLDYMVRDNNWPSIIVITYDEYIFFIDNRI